MERPEQMAVGGMGGMHADNLHSRVAGARLAAVTGTCIASLRPGFPQKAAKPDPPPLYASAGSEVVR